MGGGGVCCALVDQLPSRSSSASSCRSDSPPLRLDPSTLALLDAFLLDKAEEEKRFKALEEEANAAHFAAATRSEDAEEKEPSMMSVAEYKAAFGENWQLSQFW